MLKRIIVAGSFLAMLATAAFGRDPVPILPVALRSADVLARTRPAEALTMLTRYAVEQHAASVAVRRALLIRLHRLNVDLGNQAAARSALQNLVQIGTTENDLLSLCWGKLGAIEENIENYRTDAAKTELANISRLIDLTTAPDLAFAIEMTYGRLYLLKADYERAIEQFQAGVDIAPRTSEPASARAEAFRNLAYTHLSLADTGQAHQSIVRALGADVGTWSARLRGLLHVANANVLIEMDRFSEAESSLARALSLSRASGLRTVEARALSDWSDLALRREHYADAERLSRQALGVAEAIGDSGTSITARANVGFALGGQGKVSEALSYIDGVAQHFRQEGDGQSLLAVIDEKGRMLERQGWLKEALAVVRAQQKLEREQFSEQRGKALAALQERFESQQNKRRIDLLEKQNRLQDADIRNRELRQVTLGLAVLLAVVLGCLISLLYRRARKSNAQLSALNDQLAEHAVRDPLTGLYNRRSFVDKMQSRAGRGDRERRTGNIEAGETFMVLDLDHFKAVNDTYGHAAGDAVLVEVAKRLQAAVRDSDTVLRWGGEEFVIYLPSCGAAEAAALALRILDAVSGTTIDTGAAHLIVEVSMGMIELPFAGLSEKDCDWQRALRLADSALYLAKNGGRNRCNQLLPADLRLDIEPCELERDLVGAIAAGHVALRTVLPSIR